MRLVNPLSAELSVLRTSAFPQLLETVRNNLRWTDRDVRLFEVGRIYLRRDGGLPEERRVLTIATGAYQSAPSWGGRVETDFYHVKGIVETALERLGVAHAEWSALEHPTFRRGHCAAVAVRGERGQPPVLLGVVGEVALAVRRGFDLDEPVFLAGFDLDRVFAVTEGVQPFKSLARFPAVYQDLALVLADSVPAEDVRRAIVRAGRPLAVAADLFDEYRGERIGPGRRSLAYRLTYQSPERTLNDREVAETHERIEAALRTQLGAEIRGK
jgi:phenylalanyl-tRNA synthetase beta chain